VAYGNGGVAVIEEASVAHQSINQQHRSINSAAKRMAYSAVWRSINVAAKAKINKIAWRGIMA